MLAELNTQFKETLAKVGVATVAEQLVLMLIRKNTR
jgi:hypothetical protein